MSNTILLHKDMTIFTSTCFMDVHSGLINFMATGYRCPVTVTDGSRRTSCVHLQNKEVKFKLDTHHYTSIVNKSSLKLILDQVLPISSQPWRSNINLLCFLNTTFYFRVQLLRFLLWYQTFYINHQKPMYIYTFGLKTK